MVLIAEDDSITRSALLDLLRAEGHDALAVETGRDAVAACTAVEPDLLIVDYGLPDMTGLDVLEKLREAADSPIAVIVTGRELSANARTAAADLGARIFGKPLSAAKFLGFLHEARHGLA
jgi:DNA-binding response OmpR family regulator